MPDTHISRDTVFIAGGQPSITYVDRQHLDMERDLARAIASPNQIVSLSGPTKSGKTVLCRHVLGNRQYIWIEGGQTSTAGAVWDKICYELNYPVEISKGNADKTTIGAGLRGLIFSVSGSQLHEAETKRKYTIDAMASATRHLIENNIALIVDDFHYLSDEAKQEFLRNIKGSVFSGLRLVLLSVAHRTFDAIRAESELTGRFISVTVPEWSADDLALIPQKGFVALNVECPEKIIEKLSAESQSSPFLMQKLCWEICYDLGVDQNPIEAIRVPAGLDLQGLYTRIAKDSGLPIYERLVAGPQIRKDRMKRPLQAGGDADVYQATLLAIAQTGPKPSVSYNEIRTELTDILADKIPQKHEVTSVLKHLSRISRDIGTDSGVDWDEEKRTLDITDPYLRFYLRWQVRDKSEKAQLRLPRTGSLF
jgi:hypothetical protein